MVSDFVYGVITEKILELKIIANEKNILYLVTSNGSQIGSVTKFKGFSLTPNEREARIALRDKDSGLENLARN